MDALLKHEKIRPAGWLARKWEDAHAAGADGSRDAASIQFLVELLPGWQQAAPLAAFLQEHGTPPIAIPGLNPVVRVTCQPASLPLLLESAWVVSIQDDRRLQTTPVRPGGLPEAPAGPGSAALADSAHPESKL